MPLVVSSVNVRGDPDEIYAMVKQIEEFPRYMPDVHEVTIVERCNGRTVSDWVTSVDGTEFLWREEEFIDDLDRRIRYRLIEGDLEKFEGSWTITPDPTGTRVELTVDFDFGIPNLADLIGPILELRVRENSEMMLEAIKRHFETAASTLEPEQRQED
jgi:ribosome-associated toxin RatA of RatAB toxin-antitoxin module